MLWIVPLSELKFKQKSATRIVLSVSDFEIVILMLHQPFVLLFENAYYARDDVLGQVANSVFKAFARFELPRPDLQQ